MLSQYIFKLSITQKRVIESNAQPDGHTCTVGQESSVICRSDNKLPVQANGSLTI